VSYREVLDTVLDAEAWEEIGADAEFGRPPPKPMPPAFLNGLTPTLDSGAIGGMPNDSRSRLLGSEGAGRRLTLRVVSTGNHASYPAALFSLWRHALGGEVDFELEDYSFDNRYCSLAGSCSLDDRFAWIGEHLRGTVVETCGGLFLKGFDDMAALAERLTGLLLHGGSGSLAARADVLLCTHPPYSCRLFWPLVQGHDNSFLGFFGGTLEAHVPTEGMRQWLLDFAQMATHPRVQFAAIAPFLAEKMRYQAGADIPAVRGFGFHVLDQGAAYFPRRLYEVLLWKNSAECDDNQADFDVLLRRAIERFASRGDQEASRGEGGATPQPLHFVHLRALRSLGDSSYTTISSFRAVVFVPYEVLLMTFYELYHVAIPLFLPTAEFASFFYYRGPVTYPHCSMELRHGEGEGLSSGAPLGDGTRSRAPYSPFTRDRIADRSVWLEAYTDWFRFPHLQRFSSLTGLVHDLLHSDLQIVSALMRRESEAALVASASYWRMAFAKVLQ